MKKKAFVTVVSMLLVFMLLCTACAPQITVLVTVPGVKGVTQADNQALGEQTRLSDKAATQATQVVNADFEQSTAFVQEQSGEPITAVSENTGNDSERENQMIAGIPAQNKMIMKFQ